MKSCEPLIVNLACTGAIPSRQMSPHVPLNHQEIVDDVGRCMELGVQMVHLHARDQDGAQSGDPELYGRLVESIRKLPGGEEMVIGITTTGRRDVRLESRMRVLALDGAVKPDMASLTLSSLNFIESASLNAPDTIRGLAAEMKNRGIKPEIEIFDLGMANFLHVLIREGFLEPPYYINVLLGNVAGAQANLLQTAALLAHLPADSIVAIAGLGRFQLTANTLGLLFADGVRVGLEDNLFFDQQRTRKASNVDLVRRILALTEQFERPMQSRRQLRTLLHLQ